MSELLSHLGVAAMVFVSTNIDDIILVAILFADPALNARSVVIGQFLGNGSLVAVSAAAAIAALAVPEEYIALLGAVPLVLGLCKLGHLRALWSSTPADTPADTGAPRGSREGKGTGSGALSVALVTIANGGDNLGIYIPLFARDSGVIPAYAVVFAVMTGIWCLAGFALVNNRAIGERLSRFGRAALPLVLIGLGVWILYGARALLP